MAAKIDRGLFEKGLSEAIEFSPESDLKKLGDPGITLRVLDCFDRLMNAGSTDELLDVTDEEILQIAIHSESLAKLYKQQRFLTDVTFSNLSSAKSARIKRVL